jgi:predicted DNA-binding protein
MKKNDKAINIRIPLELYKKLKATGKPISYFVRLAIEKIIKGGD